MSHGDMDRDGHIAIPFLFDHCSSSVTKSFITV